MESGIEGRGGITKENEGTKEITLRYLVSSRHSVWFELSCLRATLLTRVCTGCNVMLLEKCVCVSHRMVCCLVSSGSTLLVEHAPSSRGADVRMARGGGSSACRRRWSQVGIVMAIRILSPAMAGKQSARGGVDLNTACRDSSVPPSDRSIGTVSWDCRLVHVLTGWTRTLQPHSRGDSGDSNQRSSGTRYQWN